MWGYADHAHCTATPIAECLFFSSFFSLLQGTVIIIAQESDQIDIPAGSVLENKIVTGNLRVLDH